jgi:3-methyl-2-oxobutanoate hydroxymethyltransferase
VIRDAVAVQEGGAFAIVLEGIPAELGELITGELDIPTIGIGAGPGCDGQVLVLHDMLHMFLDFTPKFAKIYADSGALTCSALERYCEEVRDGRFPAEEHCY